MNVIATITDTYTAFVVVWSNGEAARDFTITSGAPFTASSLAEAANNITSHYFGFTADLTKTYGSDGWNLSNLDFSASN